ncbi:MAG: L,D-transpeptidase family protein [Lachnospiraceae bacterium]|nr:L,D-transpeptidase family protein [Lachnospiraceae bacterium]
MKFTGGVEIAMKFTDAGKRQNCWKKSVAGAALLCGIFVFCILTTTARAAKMHTNDLDGVRQVVLVTVPSSSSNNANVTAYECEKEGKWSKTKESEGRVGKNGITPISSRRQGDKKTPQGILKLMQAFGRKADPDSVFEYTKITEDMYWNLNSGQETYNQLVYENPGGNYEHLIDYKTYNYMFTTDYNVEQIEKKGGAIFFHCNGKSATSGCISVPQSTMKWYMSWLEPDKNPTLIVTTEEAVQKYFVPAAKIKSVKADSANSLKISWERVS